MSVFTRKYELYINISPVDAVADDAAANSNINPFISVAPKTQPDYFGDISLTKATFGKNLKGSCSSQH